jgi:predicted amidohydrolase
MVRFKISAQSSLEYLLLIGGAVLVAAVVILLMSNVINSQAEKTEKAEDVFGEQHGALTELIDEVSKDTRAEDTASAEDNKISVASIKLRSEEYSWDSLERKINALFTDHSSVDLIVTPEYIFYKDYKKDPVIVDCKNESCIVTSIGTPKSDELKNVIGNLQNIAQENKTNIVFGTLAERATINGFDVSFNTLLIIDSKGDIKGKIRKASRYDFYAKHIVNCGTDYSFCEDVITAALETIQSFTLTAATGTSFKIAPIICGDKDKEEILNKLVNSNADLIVIPEVDRDCSAPEVNYEFLMQAFQSGDDIPPVDPYECWSLLQNLMPIWIEDKKIVKSNGYLLVSEGHLGMGAILSFERQPIESLEINDDYVFGIITIE